MVKIRWFKRFINALLALTTVLYLTGLVGIPSPAEAATAAWPMFHHDPQHTGQSPYLGVQSANLLWKRYLSNNYVVSSPAIGSDGTIYVGSNALYAINPTTGVEKWYFYTGGYNVVSSPAINGGLIYFGCNNGLLYCVNSSGNSQWSYPSYPTYSAIESSPTISSDGTVIYFGCDDGKVYAVYTGNNANPAGTLKWSLSTGGPVKSSPSDW